MLLHCPSTSKIMLGKLYNSHPVKARVTPVLFKAWFSDEAGHKHSIIPCNCSKKFLTSTRAQPMAFQRSATGSSSRVTVCRSSTVSCTLAITANNQMTAKLVYIQLQCVKTMHHIQACKGGGWRGFGPPKVFIHRQAILFDRSLTIVQNQQF